MQFYFLYYIIVIVRYGLLVKRLRRRPLTAESGVRFPYRLLTVYYNSPTPKKAILYGLPFLFMHRERPYYAHLLPIDFYFIFVYNKGYRPKALILDIGEHMKTVTISQNGHQSMAGSYGNIDTELEQLGYCYHFKLADRMNERNLTVRKLAALSGLRLATISDMMLGKKNSINLHHLVLLMSALRIHDINEIVEIHIPDSIKATMDQEKTQWLQTLQVPAETKRLASVVNEIVE